MLYKIHLLIFIKYQLDFKVYYLNLHLYNYFPPKIILILFIFTLLPYNIKFNLNLFHQFQY